MDMNYLQAMYLRRGEPEMADLMCGLDDILQGQDTARLELVPDNQSAVGVVGKALQFRLFDGRVINAWWEL